MVAGHGPVGGGEEFGQIAKINGVIINVCLRHHLDDKIACPPLTMVAKTATLT